MLKMDALFKAQEKSLLGRIKTYKSVAQEIKRHLDKNPEDWGRFQSDFNRAVNTVFCEVMEFERGRLVRGDEESVYKLKQLFVTRLRKEFLYGDYSVWSLNKPYGYAGDFKIIDDIYKNNPQTRGFDRLLDNYFQASAISVAVRNRKEDFKRIILSSVPLRSEGTIKIMDLASGPCRELKELMDGELRERQEVVFDCYDQDGRAIQYAQALLQGFEKRVNFIRENAVRIALRNNIEIQLPQKYDLIYSTGLFDYLDRRISTRLVRNLRKMLRPGGILAISDVWDKYKNPSVHYMEWIGDWNLVYRSAEEFQKIFTDGGFREDDLKFGAEQQGVLQYILGKKTDEPIDG